MAETEQTKVCPLCAETIKAAAKVCPYCRKSQRRWAFLTLYDIGGILTALLLIGTIFVFEQIFYPQRDFGLYKDKIQIANLNFGVQKNGPETNAIVTGILTNKSEYAWDIGDFEIRYLDKAGNLVAADHSSDSFIILPHGDRAFSLTLAERKTIPQYAAYKVDVISAEPPEEPFRLLDDW